MVHEHWERALFVARVSIVVNLIYRFLIFDFPKRGNQRSSIENIAKAIYEQWDVPALSGRESHERWLAAKEREGKTDHPCYKPYDQLPRRQKVKDFIFLTLCKVTNPYRGDNHWGF